MPLLANGHEHTFLQPPNLDGFEEVWKMRFTNEIFTDYQEYLKRWEFYRTRQFKCRWSFKGKLTFEEAICRERDILKEIKNLPESLMKIVCKKTQHSVIKMSDLVADIQNACRSSETPPKKTLIPSLVRYISTQPRPTLPRFVNKDYVEKYNLPVDLPRKLKILYVEWEQKQEDAKMKAALRDAGFTKSKLIEDLCLPNAWTPVPSDLQLTNLDSDGYFSSLIQVYDFINRFNETLRVSKFNINQLESNLFEHSESSLVQTILLRELEAGRLNWEEENAIEEGEEEEDQEEKVNPLGKSKVRAVQVKNLKQFLIYRGLFEELPQALQDALSANMRTLNNCESENKLTLLQTMLQECREYEGIIEQVERNLEKEGEMDEKLKSQQLKEKADIMEFEENLRKEKVIFKEFNQTPDPVTALEKRFRAQDRAVKKKKADEQEEEASSLHANRLKDMARKRKFDQAFKEQKFLISKKQKLEASVKKLDDKVKAMRKETYGRHRLRMIEFIQKHGNSLQHIGEDRFFRRYYWCPDFENCIYVANIGKNVNAIHEQLSVQKGVELKQDVEIYSPWDSLEPITDISWGALQANQFETFGNWLNDLGSREGNLKSALQVILKSLRSFNPRKAKWQNKYKN